jgi:hypothetical protein
LNKAKPRIIDIDTKPARLIDSADIAADVEKFLAAGGLIDRPGFRRDFCEIGPESDNARTRRRWVTMPPELREPAKRGGKRK